MDPATMMIPDPNTCPPLGQNPTMREFRAGLGDYAYGLYAICGFVTAILAILYGLLIGHVLHNVPRKRQVATLWVNSIYLVVAVFTTLSVVLPVCSNFVWLFFKVYIAIAMVKYVELTMAWYGGETEMLVHVGEDTLVSFRSMPCCCCICCCPKATNLTKPKIKFIKGCVYQMPYVQSAVLFIMAVLTLGKYLDYGNLNPATPYFYCIFMLLVSFLLGLWGLFMFMDVTRKYQLLVDYAYRKKSILIKLMVVFVNIQGLIIDTCARYGAIDCVAPFLSASAVADIIKALLLLSQSLVLGCWAFRLYTTDHVLD